MTDWDDYRLALALHRAGTLRGAADSLGTTHTTIARRLEHMHKRRGVTIFERTRGGYVPTEFGLQLLDVADRIEEIAFSDSRAQHAIRAELAGRVCLSVSEPFMQYLLLDELMEFSRLYPAINLVIKSSSDFADLDRSEADVVIRKMDNPEPHLVGRRLFPYALGFYGDEHYLKITKPADLEWIAPFEANIWSDWLKDSPYPNARIAVEIDDIVTRFEALKAGHGIARAACFMADTTPNLVRLPGTRPVLQSTIWILTHPDLKNIPRIKTLMRFLASAIERKRSLIVGQFADDA